MTITEAERQLIIENERARAKEELRKRMSAMGSVRSKKKRMSSRKTIEIARATRLARQLGAVKPKGKK